MFAVGCLDQAMPDSNFHHFVAIALLVGPGCGVAAPPQTPAGTGISGWGTDSGVDGSATAGHTEDAMASSSGDSAADDDTTGGLKLDVGVDGTSTGACVGDACNDTGCTAVDLLFVIDNSASMQPYQVALAEAFPTFADAVVEGLPPGVNLHVGVTSTEMGYSSLGNNEIQYVNGQATSCAATGDDDLASAEFYQTPVDDPTNTNGAQGRLYVAAGQPYFDLDTDAGPAQVAELSAWFADAAQIGEFGSQVEMSAATAAWAMDPVNAGSNDGFVRDAGAVLVLFFIQDEHDQTPEAATASLVDKVATAKQACGGFDCVVGGGFVNEDCLSLTPLGSLFDEIGADVITEVLPPPEQASAETFEATLRDTLSQVIVEACDKIEPEG